MDHLEQFRGTYDIKKQRLERRRDIIIAAARQFVPVNFEELLAQSDNREASFPLKWVKVPDPVTDYETPVLDVRLILELWEGDGEGKGSGLSGLTLIGKLPEGDEKAIGSIYALSGEHTPVLIIDNLGVTKWDSADAEIFLKLADSVMQAQ